MVLYGGVATTGLSAGLGAGAGIGLTGLSLPLAGIGLGFGIKALIDANRIKAANRRIGESNATANKYYSNDPFNSPYSTSELKTAQAQMDQSANYQPMQNEMNRSFNDSGFYQKQANINDQIQGNLYKQFESGYQPSGLEALSPAYQLFTKGLNPDGSPNYTLKGGTQQNTYNGGATYNQPRQNQPSQNGQPEDLQRYYSETLRPLANMISNNTMVDMIDTIPIQQKQMQFLPTQQYNDSAFRPGGYFYGS